MRVTYFHFIYYSFEGLGLRSPDDLGLRSSDDCKVIWQNVDKFCCIVNFSREKVVVLTVQFLTISCLLSYAFEINSIPFEVIGGKFYCGHVCFETSVDLFRWFVFMLVF